MENKKQTMFSDIILKSPNQVAYKTFGLLNQWQKLAKEEKRLKMREMLRKMKDGLSSWSSMPWQGFCFRSLRGLSSVVVSLDVLLPPGAVYRLSACSGFFV